MDKIKNGITTFKQYMKDTWQLKLIALILLGISTFCNCVIFKGELDNPSGFIGFIALILLIVKL